MSSKLGKVIANFEVQLATKISVGATSATLSSILDKDGNTIPNGRYFFTIDPDNSRKEHFSCVITGTAVTQLKTINRTTAAETSGALREHKVGAKVIITDFAVLAIVQQILDGAAPLDSANPIYYDANPTLSSGAQLATVQYVLDTVTGGSVSFDIQTLSAQIAGEALTSRDIVYLKESDQKWYKADANLITPFTQVKLGVAMSTVNTNDPVQVAISGPVGSFSGLTAGSKYYLSDTAGAISTSKGTNGVFIGWAMSTTQILLEIASKTIPVAELGTTPSPDNFIVEENLSTAGTDQSQTTQNSYVELGEANATTKKNKIAQSFIPRRVKTRGVSLYKTADTGTFTGTVTVSIQADSSGSPSGTALVSKTISNAEWLAKSTGELEIEFASEYSLAPGTTYWIVGESSTSDNSNHPNFGVNTAGGYSNGSVKYNNTTDGWTAIATIDFYFKTLEGIANQVVKTNASGKIESKFYDTAELPLPAFWQRVIQKGVGDQVTASTSTPDGSVIITYDTSSFERYERDSKTGVYVPTHSISGGYGTIKIGLAIIGNYLYVIRDGGTNLACLRFDVADLTNQTTMTVPTVAASGSDSIITWTDGTFLYTTTTSGSTVHKWSLSGTTFSAVSTATAAFSIGDRFKSSMFDGSNVYIVTADPNTNDGITISKLTNVDGSSITTTTKKILGATDSAVAYTPKPQGIIAANIDSGRMYVGNVNVIGTDSAVSLDLVPITKP